MFRELILMHTIHAIKSKTKERSQGSTMYVSAVQALQERLFSHCN